MGSNFVRFHEILNQALAENFTCLTQKLANPPSKSGSSFPNRHPLLRNLHLTFDWHYIGQNRVEILQNVDFSEYMNFNNYSGYYYLWLMETGDPSDALDGPQYINKIFAVTEFPKNLELENIRISNTNKITNWENIYIATKNTTLNKSEKS